MVTDSKPIRGEVHWANLEPVEGSEQGKTRPVLIISNNLMNETATVVIIIPMTRGEERAKAGPFNIPYSIKYIDIDETGIKELKEQGYLFTPIGGVLLCNQARTVSLKRLLGRVGKFNNALIIKAVEEAIKHSYALESCEDCGIPIRPYGIACARCGRLYRIKCINCGFIFPNEYNYCPKCGGRSKIESLK